MNYKSLVSVVVWHAWRRVCKLSRENVGALLLRWGGSFRPLLLEATGQEYLPVLPTYRCETPFKGCVFVLNIFFVPLLSHKKEWSWVICSDVDESRVCHTECSKSEREKPILYINAYIWILEKWSWWTYLQGRKRDADVENGLVDTGGDGEGGTNWESSMDIYTLPCVKEIASGKMLYSTGSSARCSVMT